MKKCSPRRGFDFFEALFWLEQQHDALAVFFRYLSRVRKKLFGRPIRDCGVLIGLTMRPLDTGEIEPLEL